MTESPALAESPLPASDPYAKLAQGWWTAILVLVILPHNLLGSAFTSAPPAAGSFDRLLLIGQVLALLVLLASLWLYRSWRERLPPVTHPRAWGPSTTEGRRRGFWILWGLFALHSWVFFGLIGARAAHEVRINGAAAYLRPQALEFAIETRPSIEQEGLIHLTLRNAGKHPLPMNPEQRLGALTLETPAGPYLLGQARLSFPVIYGPGQVATAPLPPEIAPGESVEFLLPFARWGAIRQAGPASLILRAQYQPAGGTLGPVYQPLDLFEGPLSALSEE